MHSVYCFSSWWKLSFDCVAILTNLDAEEYQIDEDEIEVSNGLVTAKITIMDKVIYVTNLHLHPMLEMIRMKEIQNIENILRALFTRGSAQVWAQFVWGGLWGGGVGEGREEEEGEQLGDTKDRGEEVIGPSGLRAL